MIVPGYHAAKEILFHRPAVAKTLFLLRSQKSGRYRELETLARKHDVPVSRVDRKFFQGFSSVSQSFALEIRHIPVDEENAFISSLNRESVVLIEEVSDPRNLGGILRVAECAGFRHVAVTSHRTAPVNETVLTSSSGALIFLHLCKVKNVRNFLRHLKADGYWIVGTGMKGENLYGRSFPRPVCVVLGSEEKGMKRLTEQTCDEVVHIPMAGNTESLNVSTAAAVVLFELFRRGWSNSS